MKKKFFSKLLMVALVATVGVFSSCKDYDDDIADVRNTMQAQATELRTDYTNKINAVNTKIETLQTSYDNLSKALDQSNAELKTLIEEKYGKAVAEAKAYSDANLVKAKDAAAAAEKAAKDYADVQAAAAQSAAIAAAKEQVAAAKAELQDALAKANEIIATQGEKITSLIEADKVLTSAVQAAQARADEAYTLADKANTLAEANKANLEKAAADISALQKSLSALESKAADKAELSKLQSDLAALQKQVSENVVNLADYKENITKLTSDLGALKEDLAKQVGFLGENIAAVKKTAEDNVAAIDGIKTQLSELAKANTQAHEQLIASVNALSQTVDNNKSAAAEALKAAVDGVMAEIAASNKLISGNTAAIASLTQTVQDNKDAQDKINAAIKGDVATNAQNIIAQGKEIEALQKLIPELEKTLKAYADKVATDKAAAAQAAAQQFALDQIAAQAKQDKENLSAFVNEVFQTLIKTYEVNVLAGLLENTRKDAEANAAAAAQIISDKALADAMTYTDRLAQTLKDNYPTIDDVNTAIEAAKSSVLAQAYVKVLNDLLRDQEEWYQQNDEKKLVELSPTIFDVAKKAVNEYGLSQANAEELMNKLIDEALQPTIEAAHGVEAKEGGKIMVLIEAAAKKAADDLAAVNNALDARLDVIEGFLNNTAKDGKTFDNAVNALIAAANLASAADVEALQAQMNGTQDSELKTLITNVQATANQNKKDIAKVLTTINNVKDLFSFLNAPATDPASEDEADKDPVQTQLDAYYEVMQKLALRIQGMVEVVDDLDNKVLKSVNEQLGPTIANMITSIHLFANQHMAQHDAYGKIEKTYIFEDGSVKREYPAGYDNFDHELTFVYTIENGWGYDYCAKNPPVAEHPSWNYPDALFTQLKTITSTKDNKMPNDYDFSYDSKGFGDRPTADFVEGRYSSYEDSILVRVNPTNANLADAEIALINSLGDDIVSAGLVNLVEVKKYDRLIVGENTRAAAGNETGLWVIKFKLNDTDPDLTEKWNKYASTKDGDILYAVAVKNTDFKEYGKDEEGNETETAIDRYIASEFDVNLDTEPAKHANEFFANNVSIEKIHNRYIQPEQSKNGETNWDDDPVYFTGSFRYELTWTDLYCPNGLPKPEAEEEGDDDVDPIVASWYSFCCDCNYQPDGTYAPECYDWNQGMRETKTFKGKYEAGWSTIKFDPANDGFIDYNTANAVQNGAKGVNAIDRKSHIIGEVGKRQAWGVDNRHLKDPLSIEFKVKGQEGEPSDFPADAKDGEGWAKITIDFPDFNLCGERTPIKGFFVTLDNHFALESDNSEINAWATYEFRNVALYNYDHGKKETDEEVKRDIAVTLQKGNHGEIFIKDARNLNDGDVIGFRVHAVNLDGTFTDPDGRAFYVVIGKQNINHSLSFDVTVEDNEKEAFAVQNLVKGKNPIAEYNKEQLAATSSDRFFNREPYLPSYLPTETYRCVLVWRGENPAIRGAGDENTYAYKPVAGTGTVAYGSGTWYNEEGNSGVYVTTPYSNTPSWNNGYVVQNFFDFWYSPNENATIDDKTGDVENEWTKFNGSYNKGKFAAPNKETMSMKASIKPYVANRLLDNETYHITMIIQRLDGQTDWKNVNTYDIDITKVMPTDMPSKFGVKSNQLTSGKWTFYLRPKGEDNPDLNPWTIQWADYGQAWIAGAKDDAAKKAQFAANFDGDINLNTTPASKIAPSLHPQRWGVDARPYNFEEMFDGLFVDEDPTAEDKTPILDQNYYFVFTGSGDFNAADAEFDKVAGDAANKDNDAIAVYKQYDNANINPDALSHDEGAYRLPPIHWSHLGETKDVNAGYIYRNISAKLDENGYFKNPMAENGDFLGQSIKNSDLVLKAVPVKVGSKKLTAEYLCAGAGVKITQTNAIVNGKVAANEFTYNQDILVECNTALFNLSSKKWKEGATEQVTVNGEKIDQLVQAYFDSYLNEIGLDIALKSDGKTAATKPEEIANGVTLAQMIQAPYQWIDLNSLKVEVTKPSGYVYTSYYYEPYWAKDGGALTSTDSFQDITGIGLKRNARTIGNSDFKEQVEGKFKFDIYDVWFHKVTMEISFKVVKPEASTARQAR